MRVSAGADMSGKGQGKLEPLKLLISIEQQSITSPFPLRVTLHLHNSGQRPLWLYRKARDASTAFHGDASRLESEERVTAYTSGGSTVAVQLAPAEAREIATAAQGMVLDSVGMPHPKLIRLAPGEDYEEKAAVRVSPALIGTTADRKPLWGRFQFTQLPFGLYWVTARRVGSPVDTAVFRHVELTPSAPAGTVELPLLPP